ncbi:MAG: nitrogen fixation protein NifQ [Sedimenticolaceae bacterium]
MPLAMVSSEPVQVYAALMAARKGDPVEETLARIIASAVCGFGAMPDWLGLGQQRFRLLMAEQFPAFDLSALEFRRRVVDVARSDEMDDLHRLLVANRSADLEVESLMADIVIAGCMGEDHLWQDLGLWERSDLSRLMLENFRPLALRNDKDMKWKKFLYKQLCETEGIYTCRSPSCEVCADYASCFGPED